jgi:hypothetical protein
VRLLTYAALALLVTVAIVAGGLRWVGTQRAPEGLPLPDKHGCWLSICLLDGRSFEGVLLALEAQPNVPARSLDVPNTTPSGNYSLVDFDYAPRQINAISVAMYWTPYTYNLVFDRTPALPALRLGDVIAALGSPRRVIFAANTLVLSYPERHLRVSVVRSRGGQPWEFLSPDDVAFALDVLAEEPDTIGAIYYLPNFAWHGFGAYQLEE